MNRKPGSQNFAISSGNGLRLALYGLIAIYAGLLLFEIAANPDRFQWDMRTYYYAGRAYSMGLSPYYLANLSQAAGSSVGFPFAYPPAVLPVLAVLSRMPYQAFYYLYLAAKLIAMALLLRLWVTKFLSGAEPIFYLFVLLGFGASTYMDFAAGNISTFEQLVLWTGLLALLSDQPYRFAFLTAAAGALKLTLLLLLPLGLLVSSTRKEYLRAMIAAGSAVACIHLLSFALGPRLFQDFLSVASQLGGEGVHSPSSLSLIRDSFAFLNDNVVPLPGAVPLAVYLAFAAVCLAFFLRDLRNARVDSASFTVYLGVLTLALVAPRLKDYSYMIVLLPTYSIIRHLPEIQSKTLVLLALMLSIQIPTPFNFEPAVERLLFEYFAFWSVLAIWIAALASRSPPTRSSSPVGAS